jgi:hypothetical protein
VSRTTNIQVIFDKAITEGSAKLRNITVTDEAGNDVKSSVSISGKYLFIYHQNVNVLNPNTLYTVTIPANSIHGLTEDFSYSFTTEKLPPPQVVSTSPADGETDVDMDTSLFTVTYDQAIVATHLNAIEVNGKVLSGESFASISDDARTLIIHYEFDPEDYWEHLRFGHVYTVTIPAGTIEDVTTPYSWSFSTPASSVIVSVTPADNATYVPVDVNMEITFDKNVRGWFHGFTENDHNLTIYANGEYLPEITVFDPFPSASDIPYEDRHRIFGISHPPLPYNSVCFVHIPADCFWGMTEDYSWSFTTGAPPAILSTIPENGATEVPLTTKIQVIFDSPVVEGAGKLSNITVKDEAGNVFTTMASITNDTLSLLHSQNLNPNTLYTVTLPANAVHGITEDFSFSFKTEKPVPEITLKDFYKVYDGKPFPASGTIKPDYLTLSFTYKGTLFDGAAYPSTDMPPTDVGNYIVTATSSEDETYASTSVTAKMTIARLAASISLSNKGAPYTGSPIPIDEAVTVPEGLPVVYSYQGTGETTYPQTANAPIEIGAYLATAIFEGNNNYAPASATAYLTISATGSPFMYLPDRWVPYNGKPQPMTGVTFIPAEAQYLAEKTTYVYWGDTYPLTANPPTEVGSYLVTATSPEDINFKSASVTARYWIGKADQTITFPDIPLKQVGSPPFYMNATASSGLPLTYTSADPSIAEVTDLGYVSIHAEGSVDITAYQAGDKNYNPDSASYTIHIVGADVLLISLSVNGQNIPVAKTMQYDSGCDTTSVFLIELVTPDGARIDRNHTFTEVIDKPDVRVITFTVTSANGQYWQTYTLTIERRFLFCDLVRTRWNNTMTIRNNPETNGGFQFQSYQWYCKPAGSSYFQPFSSGQSYSAGNKGEELHPDDTYIVEVVTNTGVRLRSCEGFPDLKTMTVDTYPNPVVHSSTLSLDADGDDEFLDNATIEIYNMQGLLLEKLPVSGRITTCPTPSGSGMYLYIFKAKNGYSKEMKVLVK